MRKDYIIKQMAETRWFYIFTDRNEKGEGLMIEVCKCENSGHNNSLPVLWKKHGHIDRILETYWSIETYVEDSEGNRYSRYNPQYKLSEDGKRMVIDFNWMFEATEENLNKIIDEIYRIASSAKGEMESFKKGKRKDALMMA